MLQFASVFSDFEIVPPLAAQLSWLHFLELIPIKNNEKRQYYARKSIEEYWSKREFNRQIELALVR